MSYTLYRYIYPHDNPYSSLLFSSLLFSFSPYSPCLFTVQATPTLPETRFCSSIVEADPDADTVAPFDADLEVGPDDVNVANDKYKASCVFNFLESFVV